MYIQKGLNLAFIPVQAKRPVETDRAAVAMNAYGVVLMHNHPSGSITPSEADKRITERLFQSANILQIKLVDHVIVAGEHWFSFKEAGLI